LNLDGCYNITDAGLVYLKDLTSLQSLDLSGCNITDAGLVHLKDLSSLRSLNLSEYQNITDAGLAHLRDLTSLKTIRLSYDCAITYTELLNLIGQKSSPAGIGMFAVATSNTQ